MKLLGKAWGANLGEVNSLYFDLVKHKISHHISYPLMGES